jgi:hypothetical protein
MNIETLYLVIIASLSVATVLLTIVGIQTIFLLKEVRAIVKRINNISLGLANTSQAVERALREVGTFSEGARLVVGILGKIVGGRKNESKQQ